jgi:hypothetical protein
MTKLISLVSLLLFGSVLVVSAQQASSAALSDVDKAGIIESVLEAELRDATDFANVRNVSSENIQFIATSQLSKHGFTLVDASQLLEWQRDGIEKYLAFKTFSLRDGVVAIALSRITAGQSCFSGHVYSELSYTYEARRTSDGWVAQLTRRPMPDFFTARKRPGAAR